MLRTGMGLVALVALALVHGTLGDLLAQERTASPAGAEVYFIDLDNGAQLQNPIAVRFGLRGMGIAPAGVEHENTGHHHLVIDAELPALDESIQSDEHYQHFGGGQSEAVIDLPPGEHTLQLLFGDHNHIPHEPPLTSQRISIHVE